MRVEPNGIVVFGCSVCVDNENEFDCFTRQRSEVEVNSVELAFVNFMPTGKDFCYPVLFIIETKDYIAFLGFVSTVHDGAEAVSSLDCNGRVLSTDDAVVFVLGQGE